MTLTVGADPEFVYRRSNGSVVPCLGLIPGTKERPFDLGDGYTCHEDNVMVELQIPPCESSVEFGAAIIEGKRRICDQFFDGRDEALVSSDSLYIGDPRSSNYSPQVFNFGCDPDYDAYQAGAMRTTLPKELTGGPSRYAGGHIHIGGPLRCPPFVAALFADLYLSLLPMVYDYMPLDRIGTMRTRWYGLPGIFRPKPYGLEYRTPSNWWTAGQSTAEMMGQQAFTLLYFLTNHTAVELKKTFTAIDWKYVQDFLRKAPPGMQLDPAALKNHRAELNALYKHCQNAGAFE